MVVDSSGECPAKNRRTLQLATGMGSAIAPFLVASMFVAAPTIGVDLHADLATLAWLTAAFFLVAASLLIPFGHIADLKGVKKVFTLGMGVYAISGAICVLAPTFEVLIIGRALTGIGAAMVFGTSIALLSLAFTDQDRSKAVGLNVTCMFAGFTGGLLLGGLLTYYLSWRYLFLFPVFIAPMVIVLLLTRVKEECTPTQEGGLDVPGMMLITISLLLIFYGLSEITNTVGLASILAGAVSALVLVWWERRSVHPLVRRSISRNRGYLMALASNVLFQAGAFAVPFLLSFYFQLVLGLDARTAGITLLLPQVLMVGLGLASGRLISRLGNRAILMIGAAINAVGVLVLLTVRVDTPIYVPIFALALVGIASGMYMPALVGWALGKVQRPDVGLASALTETSRLLGMTFSNMIMIVAFSLVLGTVSIAQATDAGFVEAVRACSIGYLIFTFICMVPPLLDPKPSSSR